MAITIATQNIWGRMPLWAPRKRMIARGLGGADIALLQEVQGWRGGSQAHQLAQAMGLGHACFASAGRTLWWREGIGVISRWPVVHTVWEKMEHPRYDLLDQIAPRLVLRVVVDSPVGRLDIYAMHLSLSRAARTRSGKAIAAFARRQRDLLATDHAVFGGDFNARADEPCLREIQEQCGVRDATGDAGPTFPAVWPVWRLDYLLVSPHLRVVRVEKRRSLGSDHRGVVLTLESSAGNPG